jgi:phage terminase large subunit-like protein
MVAACLPRLGKSRILERRSLVPDLPREWHARAAKALRIFKRLRLPDVVGMPTFGEVCGDWFLDILVALFGSYDPVTQRRAVRNYVANSGKAEDAQTTARPSY